MIDFVSIARERETMHLQGLLSMWRQAPADTPRRAAIIAAVERVLIEERGDPPPLWRRRP